MKCIAARYSAAQHLRQCHTRVPFHRYHGRSDIHPALGKSDYEALASFRQALRRFLAFSQQAAKEAGLTTRQHQAMLAIKGFPNGDCIAIGDLAEQLLIRHHSAVELADRLEQAGLVVRSTDPNDRRRVLVTLTEAAEAKLQGLSGAHLDELRAMRPALAKLLEAVSRQG